MDLPLRFFAATYDGKKYPGSSACTGIEQGANCQYFVYEVLRHFGYTPPDFRSSELWDDVTHSKKVNDLEPLDVVFFNRTDDSYGAHLGLYLGHDKVLHLAKEVGHPTVWSFAEFKKREHHQVFLGAKRMKTHT